MPKIESLQGAAMRSLWAAAYVALATVALAAVALVTVSLATVALTAAASAAENNTVLQRGAALVNKNCSRCHAVGRTGTSSHPQAPVFRTLGKRYSIASLEEALGEGIISGHPDMPEFRFSAADVGAIVAYLKSIQRQ